MAHFVAEWAGLAVLLAGSSKPASRILIFSIAMEANKSFYVKFIATYAPPFLGYIISVLAMVTIRILVFFYLFLVVIH